MVPIKGPILPKAQDLVLAGQEEQRRNRMNKYGPRGRTTAGPYE